jgi:Asp/Glu/hydantoin racemase
MPSTRSPNRIALIHAVRVAMAPVESALRALWPGVQWTHLLDDSLPADLEAAGRLTPELETRIQRLTDYALASGSTGILFTCSAFGAAIAKSAQTTLVPVLRPNDAMFEAALEAGTRIGMLATFEPAVASMTKEFEELARSRGSSATLETVCVPEAIRAARSGDIDRHDALVAQAAPRLAQCDAVMLAHFSTSTALEPVRRALAIPVFGAPEAAVLSLKTRMSA